MKPPQRHDKETRHRVTGAAQLLYLRTPRNPPAKGLKTAKKNQGGPESQAGSDSGEGGTRCKNHGANLEGIRRKKPYREGKKA